MGPLSISRSTPCIVLRSSSSSAPVPFASSADEGPAASSSSPRTSSDRVFGVGLLDEGYRDRRNTVSGESPRNGRALLDASTTGAVGVVEPLAGGVSPSAGSSESTLALGVVKFESMGDLARGGDSKPEKDETGEFSE